MLESPGELLNPPTLRPHLTQIKSASLPPSKVIVHVQPVLLRTTDLGGLKWKKKQNQKRNANSKEKKKQSKDEMLL